MFHRFYESWPQPWKKGDENTKLQATLHILTRRLQSVGLIGVIYYKF